MALVPCKIPASSRTSRCGARSPRCRCSCGAGPVAAPLSPGRGRSLPPPAAWTQRRNSNTPSSSTTQHKRFTSCFHSLPSITVKNSEINSDVTHQLGVDGNISVLIVAVFHFLVGHELQRAMCYSEHTRNKTLQIWL